MFKPKICPNFIIGENLLFGGNQYLPTNLILGELRELPQELRLRQGVRPHEEGRSLQGPARRMSSPCRFPEF